MFGRLLFVWIGLLAPTALAQTIEIAYQQVRNDNRPIILQSTFGQLTIDHSLRLGNRTNLAVQVRLSTQTALPFIYFLNQRGDYEQSIQFWLPPQTRFSVPLLVYAQQGATTIYADQIKVSVTFVKNQQVLGTILSAVNLTAYLRDTPKKRPKGLLQKPAGYDVITVDGLPARFDTTDFPLRIYSNHHKICGYEYDYLVRRSLNLWNSVAMGIGLKRPFFEYVDEPEAADIRIDWSNRVLEIDPSEQEGIDFLAFTSIKPRMGSNSTGEMMETLSQELSRLLGIRSSSTPGDLMNGTAHAQWHNLSKVHFTERDRQILSWLYAQNPYCRIKKTAL